MKLIPLTKGKVAQVSDEDYERVNALRWYAHFKPHSGNWYARAVIRKAGTRVHLQMHSFILPPPDGYEVDHRDRDGLNNQRENLRHGTASQNQGNRAGVRGRALPKGVRCDRPGSYRGDIEHAGVRYRSKRVRTIAEAQAWYEAKAREFFGEFARTEP